MVFCEGRLGSSAGAYCRAHCSFLSELSAGSSSALGEFERLFYDAERRRSELQFLRFFAGHPRRIGDVAAGLDDAADEFAKVIQNDEVILRAVIAVAEHLLINFNQAEDANGDTGFFAQLALKGAGNRFSQLQNTAGDGPAAFKGRLASADEERATVVNDHTADSNDRTFRIFSLCCFLRAHRVA